ncbi:DUF1801 domain-containing protein [Asanoa sp. NPDC050611]|uniref:iron chaperone n=1 Tax=Asanoa sp. NPDC050611 TaxID=3157098 RepID=UPI00340B0BF7
MPAKKSASSNYEGFTAEERDAMKERAKELKRATAKSDGEAELRAKIAEMTDTDRALAERVHKLVMTAAPELTPKTWYGMPAYAKDGKLICFFQPAQKFKSRYATFGFDANANLDEGNMWATSYALTKLTAADEKRLAALVKQAVS